MTMTRLSEQLEREAEVARNNLAADLGELRHRMTPGQIVEEVVNYARDTPVTEVARNLTRDLRDHPLPLLLIGAAIAWAIIASSRRPRIVVEEGPPETKVPAWHPQRETRKRSEWEVAALAPAAGS
jgi:hypothetical protein